MTHTPLDHAHADMESSDAARLRFYECLAQSELFLLLEAEPTGDQITPRLFPVEDAQVVLVFDREDRLADFVGAAPYVALSGRVLAGMLSGQNISLGLNLEVAPSSIILPPEALTWLHETLDTAATDMEEMPQEILPPKGLPDALITGLDGKLALATGLARAAYLCAVTYQGGAKSHMLALIDPLPGAEPALTNAVKEALVFSGIEAGMLDVAFFKSSDAVTTRLAKVGLRFDLPEPIQPNAPKPPGMDPARPPKL